MSMEAAQANFGVRTPEEIVRRHCHGRSQPMTTSSLRIHSAVDPSDSRELWLHSASLIGYINWLATLMCQLIAIPLLCPFYALNAARHRSQLETSSNISFTSQLL